MSSDPADVANEIARRVFGAGASVFAKPSAYQTLVEKRWFAVLIHHGVQIDIEWGATSGGAVEKILRRLLSDVKDSHAGTADLLQRARDAGIEARQ